MPIYKYKSFAEAEQHLKELQSRDPLRRLSDLQDLFYALKPPGKVQRGLFKFKTLEEADEHRRRTTG
ncbi:hypothetical protein HUU40_32720 [candidate division KSB1 bacterium]|nr:hypothetical protein [candidate division KSB1 bacterium]